MSRRVRYTVQPQGNGWDVTKGGKPVSHHRTKDVAVEKGRRLAKAEDLGQLVIKKQNGRIQEERTYGADPFPPRG